MASNTKYYDNLTVSNSPHLVTSLDTTKTMLFVVAALCPAAVMSIVYFGVPAVVLIAVCMAACAFFEWAYEKILNKPVTVRDGSALVTGLILALNLPANLTRLESIQYPIFMPILIDRHHRQLCRDRHRQAALWRYGKELREPGYRRPYYPVPVLYFLYVLLADNQFPEDRRCYQRDPSGLSGRRQPCLCAFPQGYVPWKHRRRHG